MLGKNQLNLFVLVYIKIHLTPLYVTTNGVNKVPTNSMSIPIPIVRTKFSNGARKLKNNIAGRMVQSTNDNLPRMVISCFVPQFVQWMGLYVHINDLRIALQLNEV